MLSEADRKQAAQAMLAAERGAALHPAHHDLSGHHHRGRLRHPERSDRGEVAAGRRVIGHKIGLTSKAMQAASWWHEPDYGVPLDDMMYADGDTLPAARFIVPRIEVELEVRAREAVAGAGGDAVRRAARDRVRAGAYFIDGRSKYWRKIEDNIADNAAWGVIVGGRTVRPLDVDLRWVAAIASKNGVVEESGVAAAGPPSGDGDCPARQQGRRVRG